MSRSAVLVSLVAVAATAGGVAVAGRPATPIAVAAPSSVLAPVTRTTLACPGASPARPSGTSVLVVTPTGARSGVGSATLSVLGAAKAPLGSVRGPGIPLSVTLPAGAAAATVVVGTGAAAAGLAAAQWSTAPASGAGARNPPSRADRTPADTGLVAGWCQAPAATWWFTGLDTAVGSTARLVLTNPTPATAVVDVSLYGPGGVIEADGARGIAVAARSRRSIDLARFAPGLAALTVGLSASSGRVAAAVQLDRRRGLVAAGSDEIAATAAPATEVLVGAGQPGPGGQRLVVTNPGTREALVQVEVVGADGAFVPAGLPDLRVPPGSVVAEDITGITGSSSSAVRLTATTPVVAGVVDETTRPVDLSVSVAGPALTTPAVVPVIPATRVRLAFSSPDRTGGSVAVDAFDRRGRPLYSRPVTLRGLTTTVWQPPTRPAASYLVVRVTVDAAVSAVALYSGSSGVASLPLISGVTTVVRPDVRPAP